VFFLDEQCRNLLKPACNCVDILLYIIVGSEKIPLCQQCWCELAESDNVEWGEEGLRVKEKISQSVEQI